MRAKKVERKGFFITFEGGEGAGKTTLIEKLRDYLQEEGFSVLSTRAPGSSFLGKKIRAILLETEPGDITPKGELFLFLADRAIHVEKEIKPALERGDVVLCDRFNDSSIAYQGIARGLGEEVVSELTLFASSGLSPDLTFYLDIDPVLGLKRASNCKKNDRIELESLSFHQKIREAYRHLATKNSDRIVTIDASKSPEIVYEAICLRLREYLQKTCW